MPLLLLLWHAPFMVRACVCVCGKQKELTDAKATHNKAKQLRQRLREQTGERQRRQWKEEERGKRGENERSSTGGVADEGCHIAS